MNSIQRLLVLIGMGYAGGAMIAFEEWVALSLLALSAGTFIFTDTRRGDEK